MNPAVCIRVHQFSKIEMFAFTHPEKSEEMHEKMREIEEQIYQDLENPVSGGKYLRG